MSYYKLHSDVGMNFQMNRVLTYGDEAGDLDAIRAIAPSIHDLESWFVQWNALARHAESEERYLHAAYAYRMAEFFLTDDRAEKQASYDAFKRNFYTAIGRDTVERFDIPYEGAALPAMRLQAADEKQVVVIHGGYDSFIEEFYLSVRDLPAQGYTVILFEGPGQGEARKRGLTFTHEWEKPTAAVLDYFKLEQVALLGISWGGYLALRAAAFEPRIQQVIAYDICYDGLEVMLCPMPTPIRQLFRLLLATRQRVIANWLTRRLRQRSTLLDWAVGHGMTITGTDSPYMFYKHLAQHTMKRISSQVQQDVLLLAGQEDHYIPLHQFYQQQQALVNVRSLTARLFTVVEGGEQHCQVGNHQLAVDTIIHWLNTLRTE